MKSRKPITAFSPHELIRFMAPVTSVMAFFMLVILIDGLLITQKPNLWMVLYGLGGLISLTVLNALVKKSALFHEKYGWHHALLAGVALGFLPLILPANLAKLFPILIVLNVIMVTIISGRLYAVITLITIILVGLSKDIQEFTKLEHILDYFGPFIVALIAMETYVRIKRTTQQHIHRLETINKVSRQLMQSLDTPQVLALLNETILDTLEAAHTSWERSKMAIFALILCMMKESFLTGRNCR